MRMIHLAAAVIALTAGAAGVSAPAAARAGDGRYDIRHENARRDHHVRHDDRRHWNNRRCRTVWSHHHRVRRCG